MKKELTFILTAACAGTLCFGSLTADKVSAKTSGDYKYEIISEEQKTCKISKYTGGGGDIEIPSTIDGYTVTEIGDQAFSSSDVANVTLPETLTIIGKYAFYGCDYIDSIKIPDNVHTIKSGAFYECDYLTDIKLPSGLKTIGNYVFESCNLKELHIPQYVESIGEESIHAEKITVDENNKFYDSRDNCNALIETSTNTLIKASKNTSFIPSTVTEIGDKAFSGIDELKEITIPASVKKIGKQAFYGCDTLEKVVLSEGLSYIGYEAFGSCDSLKDIDLPDSVEKLMRRCFVSCKKIESIHIPANLKDTDFNSVFDGCQLKNISVAEGNALYDSRDNCNAIIEKSTDTLLVACDNSKIPASVKKIAPNAFDSLDGITEISIPDSVIEIGEGAFYHCENLKKVKLPAKLKSIEANTFSRTALEEIKIPEGVTIIKESAFAESKLNKISLPDSLITIEGTAFDCPLTELYIPRNLKNAVWSDVFCGSFNNNSLKSLKVDPKNPYYDSRNNCNAVIEKSSGTLVMACNKTTIPASVIKIGDFAFYELCKISKINIPKSVKSIGPDAFSRCDNLETITFASGTRTIPATIVMESFKFTKITIPKSVKRIRSSSLLSNLKTINYKGSKADWKKIKIDNPKDLKRVKINYNYKK